MDPRFVGVLGDSANGVLTAALWSPELPCSGAQDCQRAYVELHSEAPDYHGAEAYAAVFVAADVLQRAETFSPEEIREALNNTDLETPFGRVRFRSYAKFERQNRTPTIVLKVADSKLEFAWPQNTATARPSSP